MACSVGPKLNRDGLVVSLDANDVNSYPGEPTVNLCSPLGEQAYDTINMSYFGIIDAVSTAFDTTLGNSKPATQGNFFAHKILSSANSSTSSNRNHYYGFQLFPYAGSLVSKTFVASAYVKGPVGKSVGIICTAASSWFANGGGSNNFTLTGDWQRIYTVAAFDGATPGTSINIRLSSYGALPDGNNGTTDDVGYTYYYSSIQLEEKTHATQFTSGTRLAANGWKNLAGTNHADLTNAVYDSSAAIDFNRSSLNYVSMSDTVSLKRTNSWTLECWNYLRSETSYDTIIVGKDGGNGGIMEWSAGTRFWFLGDYSGGWNYYNISASTVLNVWRHLVATFNSANKEMNFYINGSLIGTSTGAETFYGYGDVLKIGGNINYNYVVDGKIPVVKVYNKVLSLPEVLQNYNNQKGRYGL